MKFVPKFQATDRRNEHKIELRSVASKLDLCPCHYFDIFGQEQYNNINVMSSERSEQFVAPTRLSEERCIEPESFTSQDSNNAHSVRPFHSIFYTKKTC